jgi:hypothetical protein
MAREIKFRAWDTVEEKLLEVREVTWLIGGGLLVQAYIDGYVVALDGAATLMQFTGLHDKNGREIYEGDVVSHFLGRRVVRWDDESAMFRGFVQDENEHIDLDLYPVEIVGNIYENPELIPNQ